MKFWKKTWVKCALLGLVLVACTAAVSEARFFRFWWLRPPAPAIEDSTYTGDALSGRVRTIVVADGNLVSYSRARLNDTEFTASVDGDAQTLTIDPILLTGSDSSDDVVTDTEVVLTFDDADLFRNFFNTKFYAQGEAIVTVTTTETDDSVDPPDVTMTTTDVTIPVVVFGSIHEHSSDGTYHLRGAVKGYDREDDPTTGERTYSLFCVYLDATDTAVVAVP